MTPGRKRWTLTGAAVVITSAVTLFGVVCALSADRAQVGFAINGHRYELTDHEDRLRTLEATTNQVATDVRWIRETLAHQTAGGD
jgi:hypothetical protein